MPEELRIAIPPEKTEYEEDLRRENSLQFELVGSVEYINGGVASFMIQRSSLVTFSSSDVCSLIIIK